MINHLKWSCGVLYYRRVELRDTGADTSNDFFLSRNSRDLISDGSNTGFRRAPQRQGRREIMLIFLWVLTILRQTQTELTKIFDGAIRRRVPLRDNYCARLALRPVLLPSNTQVGQHEKNANQCN